MVVKLIEILQDPHILIQSPNYLGNIWKLMKKNSGIFSLLDFEHGWEESVTWGADPESLFLYLLDRLVALFLVPWSEDYWSYLSIHKAKPMHLRVVRKRNNWSAAILIAPCSPFSSFSWPQANFLCVCQNQRSGWTIVVLTQPIESGDVQIGREDPGQHF